MFSTKAFTITMICHYAVWRSDERNILFMIMLNVIMLSVVVLNVIMLRVVMLNAIMLRVVMLNVIMLSVIMLSVVTPIQTLLKVMPLRVLKVQGKFQNYISLNRKNYCFTVLYYLAIQMYLEEVRENPQCPTCS